MVCFLFERALGDEGINTGSCCRVRKHCSLLMKVTKQSDNQTVPATGKVFDLSVQLAQATKSHMG